MLVDILLDIAALIIVAVIAYWRLHSGEIIVRSPKSISSLCRGVRSGIGYYGMDLTNRALGGGSHSSHSLIGFYTLGLPVQSGREPTMSWQNPKDRNFSAAAICAASDSGGS